MPAIYTLDDAQYTGDGRLIRHMSTMRPEAIAAMRRALEQIAFEARPVRDPLQILGGDVRAADTRFEIIRSVATNALKAQSLDSQASNH